MLEEERKKVSFDVNELSYLIYGSPEKLKAFLEIQKTISNDPILKFNPEHIQISRKEIMEIMAKKLIRQHEIFGYDPEIKAMSPLFWQEQMPLSMHYSMFILTLRNLGTEKQKKMFLEPALNLDIHGCYAQTELSHGSDVQNLETTATYDKQTQSFILNSPTPGSVKWWIGDLGVFATHTVLTAQLIINNKKYGPHYFVVKIRDQKTHKPVEGVEVGDIGPKYGFNAKDNGYLKMTNVRIPREHMLMKFSKVSKEGEFQRRGNDKISYATMLTIRARIPISCFYVLSKAVTIVTRYSLIRKQFTNNAGNEIQIFDYQLQQEKIIPHIAQTYATLFAFKQCSEMAINVLKDATEKNEFERLNPTHSLSSSVKAVITSDTLKAMEILRRSAGGHGFSSYSGLPQIQAEIAPSATYQGENTVLLLQTARFLIKSFHSIKKGKHLPELVSFFEQVSNAPTLEVKIESLREFNCPETIRKVFMNHSYFKVAAANNRLIAGIKEGLSYKQSWDQHAGILLTEAAAAFTYMWIFNAFTLGVKTINNQNLKTVMNKLLCLYGIQKILENASGYHQGRILNSTAFKLAFTAKEKLLGELRNEAIGLVEAFCYDDNTLASAIGKRDGTAYETLYDWAKNANRVNKPEVQKEFIEMIGRKNGKLNLSKI